jgi:hypothetical protein
VRVGESDVPRPKQSRSLEVPREALVSVVRGLRVVDSILTEARRAKDEGGENSAGSITGRSMAEGSGLGGLWWALAGTTPPLAEWLKMSLRLRMPLSDLVAQLSFPGILYARTKSSR